MIIASVWKSLIIRERVRILRVSLANSPSIYDTATVAVPLARLWFGDIGIEDFTFKGISRYT